MSDATLLAALTVLQFCEEENISKTLYYNEKAAGRGPVETRVGNVVRICRQSQAAWRKAREFARAPKTPQSWPARPRRVAPGRGRLRPPLSPRHCTFPEPAEVLNGPSSARGDRASPIR